MTPEQAEWRRLLIRVRRPMRFYRGSGPVLLELEDMQAEEAAYWREVMNEIFP